ncbi:uncharacterized protein LOC122377128 isoform X2 [Amphibalanus amphitrite]|uniref:uncharacterized protein LOC122377128 isoform X2 n=1 Tax=Amphibalanus amphitrite TaxID=1232801 RepID=UPI001C90261B|nr:uncharacterized protein LOC122377128 isoform X2 [Amphibalanus amphitrite]XP_043213028.1 uncharacterized protein LOC122377128 isoform X2 [Amphibalanus amphitrite]
MRAALFLLAVSALVLAAVADRTSAGSGAPIRHRGRALLGRRRSSPVLRRMFRSPTVQRWYIRPLPADGTESAQLPNTIILKRVSATESGPLLLPLAHGSAQLGVAQPSAQLVAQRSDQLPVQLSRSDTASATPAPLAVNRQGRRPAQRPWSLLASRRRQSGATWVYPSAEPSLAPAGHWEGPSAQSDFFFEPFYERSDRAASRARKTPPRRRAPAARRYQKPAASHFAHHRRASHSGPHTSVSVGTSVLYPGTVISDVSRSTDDVIYDAAVDPQQSASRMTPGVGFRLPPNSVEYGGWKPVSA